MWTRRKPSAARARKNHKFLRADGLKLLIIWPEMCQIIVENQFSKNFKRAI
jgi:hypothetical protein